MKSISKGLWIGGILVVVAGAVILLGPVAGCRPPGWRDGPFEPSFCRRGPRFADSDFSERILKHVDRHVAELSLTETQQQSYEALKGKLKTHLQEGKTRRVEWVSELRTELRKDKPDIQVVASHVKKATRALPEAMDRHVDLFVQFYSILDEEQRRKVLERFRDRIGGTS
jgi:Spy/CpxP family protein refolding chaperone